MNDITPELMKNIFISLLLLFFITTSCKKEVAIKKTSYTLIKSNNPNTKENSQSIELNGDYYIKTKVASIETGDPIEISFYFNFEGSQTILSIGTNNSLEAYCEGTYNIRPNNEVLKLIYTGEGTCTSDEEESSFLIKKENNQYYIKSKRFFDFEWHLLNTEKHTDAEDNRSVQYKKNENINASIQKIKLPNKWVGKYTAYYSYGKIGGENAGWNLDIEISNDSIIANGEGYQIGFKDLLIAKEKDNELVLNHLKNLNGYKLGAKMNPEFVLIENKGKYFIKTKWIDSDIVTKPKELGYEITKQ